MADKVAEALYKGTRREGFGRNRGHIGAFGEFTEGVLTDKANLVAQALMAPGNALQGQYNELEVSPSGAVSQMDPRLMQDAATLAGTVSLGSVATPVPANAVGMGLKMFHGSPDIRWLDEGQAFSGANPVTAPSKYMFASPKRGVAETYAGISEMARWRAENGMGQPAGPNAGIRQVELQDGAKVLKIQDVNKIPAELGVQWGGPDSLERLLDAAKAKGYDAVQLIPDGGNYAIINPAAVKRITKPRG